MLNTNLMKYVPPPTSALPNAVVDSRYEVKERPDTETIVKKTEETRVALERIVEGKIKAAKPKEAVHKKEEPQIVRYTPAQQGAAFNSGAQQRIVRMVEAPIDPLEPPKFRHKRIPKGPPSPPAPVLHSPPRKVSVQEQKEWNIPPSISNWKNPKGYTIPLDKRLVTDGRGLQDVYINDKFAKLSESLYMADRQAREEIHQREIIRQKLAQNEKFQKEDSLRKLAQKAREERSGMKQQETEDELQDIKERDELRAERRREVERQQRMQHMSAERRTKLMEREQNRDISEKIALGLAQPTMSKDMMYDQRLFNQSEGVTSGLMDEEAYNVYDKPLFNHSQASSIYRYRKDGDDDNKRSGPVQFQTQEEADPFGIGQFLSEAKEGKRSDKSNTRSNNDDDREDRDSKRRRA